jgi:hypothetical protein
MESVDIKKPTFWELNKDAFSSQLKGTTTPNTKKYIITVDKSIQSTNGKTITLNKGDIIQGIEISSFGNMANDSGSQSMTFEDKNGNRFSVGVGYRGFQPFFEENKSSFWQSQEFNGGNCGVVGCWGTDAQGRKTLNGQLFELSNTQKDAQQELLREKILTKEAQANQSGQTQGSTTKEPIYYILVTAGVLIAGYFAYKKFKK